MVKNNRVIEFEPKERIFEKAKKYVESVEAFLEERDRAVPLLLRAFRHADSKLKQEILLLLGSFAKEQSIGPFYEIMTDGAEDEDIRNLASIQISVMGPLLKDSQPLIDKLLKDSASADAVLRSHATFALGWQGNFEAAIPLIERLYDSDDRVRQTAVNALCNLRDDRVLPLLRERLEHGGAEQKHCILLNLWRFAAKRQEVIDVYLHCAQDNDPGVRFDALVCVGLLTQVRDYIALYRRLLRDLDPRIRGLAIKRLAEDAADSARQSFPTEIEALLEDPDMEVKKAALKILGKRRV